MRETYLINVADPESTLGWAIADSIELAKRLNRPVIAHVRGIACLVKKDTTIEEGISRYRRTVERFARVRN